MSSFRLALFAQFTVHFWYKVLTALSFARKDEELLFTVPKYSFTSSFLSPSSVLLYLLLTYAHALASSISPSRFFLKINCSSLYSTMPDQPAAPAPRGSIASIFGGSVNVGRPSMDGLSGVGAGGSGAGISLDGQSEEIEVSVATPSLGCGIKDAIGGVVVVSLVEGGEGERLGMIIGDLIHSVLFELCTISVFFSRPSYSVYKTSTSRARYNLLILLSLCATLSTVLWRGVAV